MQEGPPVMEPEAESVNESPVLETNESVPAVPEQNQFQTETANIFSQQAEIENTSTGNILEGNAKSVTIEHGVSDLEQKPESLDTFTENSSKETVEINVDTQETGEKKQEQLRSVREKLEKFNSTGEPPQPPENPGDLPKTEDRPEKRKPTTYSFETYIKYKPCELCRGSGRKFFIFNCPKCKGKGSLEASRSDKVNEYEITKPMKQPAPSSVSSSVPAPEQVPQVEPDMVTPETYGESAEKITINPEQTPQPKESETWTGNTYEGVGAPRTIEASANEPQQNIEEPTTYTDNTSHETSEVNVDAGGSSEAAK